MHNTQAKVTKAIFGRDNSDELAYAPNVVYSFVRRSMADTPKPQKSPLKEVCFIIADF